MSWRRELHAPHQPWHDAFAQALHHFPGFFGLILMMLFQFQVVSFPGFSLLVPAIPVYLFLPYRNLVGTGDITHRKDKNKYKKKE